MATVVRTGATVGGAFAPLDHLISVQAPSQMVVPLNASVSRRTGAFGTQEGACTGDNPTDRADVIVLWRPCNQVRALPRRTLLPATVLDDRGLLPLNLE